MRLRLTPLENYLLSAMAQAGERTIEREGHPELGRAILHARSVIVASD